ncbi:hypothetical protein, partial [Streptomyces sp900116325]|uniref:hypothetical protein n=1 Tax=Streptomyces sp. 900116325 TaxID=3154295 RepID=UPI00340D0215
VEIVAGDLNGHSEFDKRNCQIVSVQLLADRRQDAVHLLLRHQTERHPPFGQHPIGLPLDIRQPGFWQRHLTSRSSLQRPAARIRI